MLEVERSAMKSKREKSEVLVALFCIPLIPLVAVPVIQRLQAPPAVPPLQEQLPDPTLKQQLRQWPAKITAVSSKVTAYLGSSPQGDAKQMQMSMAAPFVLCSLIKRYPRSSPSAKSALIESFQVDWSSEVEASSGLDFWLAYNRRDQTLFQVSFGAGGGHGTQFQGVTDELLLHLDKEVTQSQTTSINLDRLAQLGCKAKNY